ncbi:MAG: hypothetical protein JRI55_06980 [Deltaproteobacteria bacterium]|nr:hypothetical protein [Deltaproteobacteria bacterium]
MESTSGVRPVRRDRRSVGRWPLHAEVEVLAPVRGRGVAINGSLGGMRIAVDCPLEEDCEYIVRTRFSAGVIRTGRARVAWSKRVRDGWIAGLYFDDRQ